MNQNVTSEHVLLRLRMLSLSICNHGCESPKKHPSGFSWFPACPSLPQSTTAALLPPEAQGQWPMLRQRHLFLSVLDKSCLNCQAAATSSEFTGNLAVALGKSTSPLGTSISHPQNPELQRWRAVIPWLSGSHTDVIPNSDWDPSTEQRSSSTPGLGHLLGTRHCVWVILLDARDTWWHGSPRCLHAVREDSEA